MMMPLLMSGRLTCRSCGSVQELQYQVGRWAFLARAGDTGVVPGTQIPRRLVTG